jgi:hypothetical protein
MDPIDPIASGSPVIPRYGLPPIERVSRERDRPEGDTQRRGRREQEQREQPKPEDDSGEHKHIDVRA